MSHFNTLVFSGGGLRGLAYIGSQKILQKYDILPHIKKLAGSSIGSVYATLINVGYTSEELYDLILNFNYETLSDINILGFSQNYGIETGEKIYQFIQFMLKKKTQIENISFKQLWEKTQQHLIINATCVNTHQIQYFDYLSNPDMPVALALRMSIALPGFIQPVEYLGKLYNDGGLTDNFPIHLFSEDDKVLGFQLSNDNQPIDKIDSLESYLLHTWSTIYNELSRLRIGKIKDNHLIINISITCIHTFNFQLNRKQRIQIYKQGYQATLSALSQFFSKQNTDTNINAENSENT